MKIEDNYIKRVFIDAHVFDGEFQGTLTYVKELYLELIPMMTNVVFYFGSRKKENLVAVFGHYENVKFVEYKSKNSFSRIFLEIPKIIKELKISYAHFQYTIPFLRGENCKYIVTIHDILFNEFPEEFSYLYRLKRNLFFYISAVRTDFLLTVSNYSKRKLAETYGLEEDKIKITHNAVSKEFYDFNFSKIESKNIIKAKYGIENFILYVSRIEPRKNQILLLEAFIESELYAKGYCLVLIGSNTLNIGLQEKISNLEVSIKSSIFWIKQVDFLELRHFINGAELFVYPSKAEGFGIPPLEAGAMGTPVLCSNVTAMEDFDFFKPYFFNPESFNEFKDLLIKVIQEKVNIDLDGIRKSIKKKYTWKNSAQVIFKIISYK